jgi:hypothetical protein
MIARPQRRAEQVVRQTLMFRAQHEPVDVPLGNLEDARIGTAGLLARGAGVLRLCRHDLPAFPLSDKPRIPAYPEIRDV